MHKLLITAAGAALIFTASAASAQPYGYYNYDHRYDREHRYDRDRDRWDRGRHWGWRHRYYSAPVRVCAWRYGERVCWYR